MPAHRRKSRMRGQNLRFPRKEFDRRVRQSRAAMEERGIDHLVIFSATGCMRFGQRGHVLYLSGYEPYFGNTMMILPADERTEPLLQIDEAKHFPSECTWIERIVGPQDPVKTVKEYLRDFRSRAIHLGIVGEYSVNPMLLDRLRVQLRGNQMTYCSDILEHMRSVKTDYEIACIRGACAIAKKGFEAAAEFARPGVRDSEVVSEIERACRAAGSEYFPHRTMFSSGKDVKYLERWWYCAERRLRKKDTMLADFGTMYGAYCCDMARVFSLGPAPKELEEVYEIIVESEKAGQKAARPGTMASEVDAASAEVLEEFRQLITTGDTTDIGHGVGLEGHEWPFLGYHHIENDPMYEDWELKKDMVISIEPQIYHPKFGIVQIEDQFRVTAGGGVLLTDLKREVLGC